MYKYQLWIRLNGGQQTTNTIVYADGDLQARLLGESMYGAGNVLNYTRIG